MRSGAYDLGFQERSNLRIGFINGMDNTFEDFHSTMRYLSEIGGGLNIHGVYNPTHGKASDLKECAMGLNFTATEPVRELHKMWDQFFDNNSNDARLLMICHSQGAIHTRNALLDYSEERRERILALAIAPGGYIYKETCEDVIHYRAEWWRDGVPRIDVLGAFRSKDTTVTLKSDEKASWFDHSFNSPTYEHKISEHIKNYINSGGRAL